MLKLVLINEGIAQELNIDTKVNALQTFQNVESYLSKIGFNGEIEFMCGGSKINAKQSISAYLNTNSVICRVKSRNNEAGIFDLIDTSKQGFTIKNFFYNSVANFYDGKSPIIEPNRPDTSENAIKTPFNVNADGYIKDHNLKDNGTKHTERNKEKEITLEKRQELMDAQPSIESLKKEYKNKYLSRDGKGDYSLQHGKFTIPKKKDTQKAKLSQKLDDVQQTEGIKGDTTKSNTVIEPQSKNINNTTHKQAVDSKVNSKHVPKPQRLAEEALLLSSSSELSEVEEGEVAKQKYSYAKVDVEDFKRESPNYLTGGIVCYRLITFDDSDIPSITDNIYGVVRQVLAQSLKIIKINSIDKDLLITNISENRKLQNSDLVLRSKKSGDDNNNTLAPNSFMKELDLEDTEEELPFDFFYTLYYLCNVEENKPCTVGGHEVIQGHEESLVKVELTKDQNESKNIVKAPSNLTKLERLTGEQVEFYFSDKNYYKDKYIQEKVTNDPDHGLTLEDLMTFNRIKNFKVGYNKLKAILRKYQSLKDTTFELLDSDKIVKRLN